MTELETGYLELRRSDDPPRRIPLDRGSFQIGRDPSCDICLADSAVSRQHARIERADDGAWRLIDLQSKNGTYVNGGSVELASVFNGDVVEIGECRMVLNLEAEWPSDGAELDLDLNLPDTVTLLVEGDDEATEAKLTAELLSKVYVTFNRLAEAANVESLLRVLARAFVEEFRPDRVAIGLRNSEEYGWPVVLDTAGNPTDGSDLPLRLIPRGRALDGSVELRWDTLYDDPKAAAELAKQATARCYVFPLKAGPHNIGHVYVERRDAMWEPGEATIRAMGMVARQAGLLLERSRLLQSRRAAMEMERELAAARQLQLHLFPRTLALGDQLDVAAVNHPCFGVSGDYYDCQLLAPGRVAFVLADVMGHGLSAALIASQLQAAFRIGCREGWTLEELDGRLDQIMIANAEPECFTTGLIGICDLATNTLSIISAGHHWPDLLCDGKQTPKVEAACGLPWGARAMQGPPKAAEIPLVGPWSLVAYTDGVCEATDDREQSYSKKRISDTHRSNQQEDAQALCDALVDDVLDFIGRSGPLPDDITVLVISSRR